MRHLPDEQFYRALVARDSRFDGVFFVGVTSTRIYCRPVCRAPKPRPDRCRYYLSAAAAERRGFRPCLRCRPELAPGGAPGAVRAGELASVDAVARLGHAAATLIAGGALDRGGLEELAAQLGVSARHVRRAVERELGASPVELAQTRRLLTAKQLLSETNLPLARVALASGFRSVRRFNAIFNERYRLAPGDLRRGIRSSTNGAVNGPDAATADLVRLTLAYRPPFDWEAMFAYLTARATPGVEAVSADGRYLRTVAVHGATGVISVRRAVQERHRRIVAGRRSDALLVELTPSLLPVLVPLLARVRRLFDLDADPQAIAEHLSGDPALAPLTARRPGLRVPGAMDPFELALRAVLGQQITVRGASTLAGRLALLGPELSCELATLATAMHAPTLTRLPLTPEHLADASLSSLVDVGLPRARAACLLALARAVADGQLPELVGDAPAANPVQFVRRFRELPGIGEWTAEYVAMRALRWPDAFPHGDLGLRKAMGGLTAARLRAAAEAWRPWRAYAAQHLWMSLADPRRRSSASPTATKRRAS